MELIETVQRLTAALAIGILVGVVRGWQEREHRDDGIRRAGVRTFGLAGLLGGLAGHLLALSGPVLPAVLLSLFGGAVIVVRLREVEIVEDFSLAGVTAALAVFVLGAIAVSGDMEIAGAGAVAVAIVLAARRSAHAFLEKLTWLELRAALVLLAMTLIALPLLPNRTIDPWDALNPFELWLLTVMIALISCTGYAAIRIAGPSRGIVFAGAAGGLASSTATTLSFARFAVKTPDNASRLAAGAIIAGALSAGRVAIIGGALAPQLARPLGLAMAPVVVIFLAAAWLLMRRNQSGGKTPGLTLDNPLDLAGVLRFGALLGVVTLASRLLLDWLGAGTLFLVAAVSGLVDVDAITLSTARLAGGEVAAGTAAAAVLLAVAVNMVAKAVLALVAGGRGYGMPLAVVTGLGVLGGAAGLALQQLLPGA
ncbi:MAG: DUF4010 domain-containing protein [Pseudomonadota bacterium]|nr:DUF4010 domain-containing protein [Pseudomonadota bacterium]